MWPPRLDGIIEPDFMEPDTSAIETRNFFADVSRAGHVDSMMVSRAATAPHGYTSQDEPPLSPTSILSEDFISCSFPSRGRTAGAGIPLGAHPVPGKLNL